MTKQCIECYEEKELNLFYKGSNQCKSCTKSKRSAEYMSDLKTSRLINRARYESDSNEARRRIRNFMKRYEK